MASLLSSPHKFGVFRSDNGLWKLSLIISSCICKPLELSTVGIIFTRLLLESQSTYLLEPNHVCMSHQSCFYIRFRLEVNLGWVLNHGLWAGSVCFMVVHKILVEWVQGVGTPYAYTCMFCSGKRGHRFHQLCQSRPPKTETPLNFQAQAVTMRWGS